MARRLLPILLLLAVLLANALACNAPLPQGGAARQATAVSVLQTIDAMAGDPASTLPANVTAAPSPAATRTPDWSTPGPIIEYQTGSGDTLSALARRFEVGPSQILGDQGLAADGYLPIGLGLQIPNALGPVSPGVHILPDSEVVYSPAAVFDVDTFVQSAGGFLASYDEEISAGRRLSGIAIVQKVAQELSVNPRLLLGLIEYRSGWVYGFPADGQADPYPLGFRIAGRRGLYQELMIAATQLNVGFYGWREGSLVETQFNDGTVIRYHPGLNAGSVAVMHLIAILRPSDRWMDSVYGEVSLPTLYTALFGDPWERAQGVDPLLPPGLAQPTLELPFSAGERWSLTGGPHQAWNAGTPRGALDFSPITGGEPCAVPDRWVTAAAPGVIARAQSNAVALDLDGDGLEQTGWVIVYLHLAQAGLIAAGTEVETGTPLGHPSCEGGVATGKHVHIARKFNGEWLAADGPVPFVLGGWRAVAEERNYYGALVRGAERVSSNSSGQQGSTIVR
jgi:murein DD-endopeptidase MepM/ murein hydrolase activator NlpD